MLIMLFVGRSMHGVAQSTPDSLKEKTTRIKIMINDGDKTVNIDTVFKGDGKVIQKAIETLNKTLVKADGEKRMHVKRVMKSKSPTEKSNGHARSFSFEFDSDKDKPITHMWMDNDSMMRVHMDKIKSLNIKTDSLQKKIMIMSMDGGETFSFDMDGGEMPGFMFFNDDCKEMPHGMMKFHGEDMPEMEEEIIIKGEDTIIIKNGGKRMMKYIGKNNSPGNFEYFINKTNDNDSIRVEVKMDNDIRHSSRRTRRASIEAPRWSHRAFSSLALKDLSSEDLENLKGSDFKTKSGYQPLGISDLNIEKAGRKILRISFRTDETKNIEVKLFNNNGETIYHELIKVFSGLYTKEISLDNFRETYFLQIKQGKKALNKKIVPDR